MRGTVTRRIVGTRSSPMVTLSLIDSFCVPLLSYGIESFNMRKADYNYVDSVYDAAFAQIFTSYDTNIIRNCQFYCGLLPFNLRIDIRRLKFYAKLNSIQNNSVRGLYIMCYVESIRRQPAEETQLVIN